MDKIEWSNEKRYLSELKDHAKNPRKISKDQLESLKKSFETFGYCEVVAVNVDGTILAGHQRVRTMRALKMTKNPIDVRVPNRELSESEADEYLIRSNKNVGEWDLEKLSCNFEAPDLKNWGFSDEEISGLEEKKSEEGEDDGFEPEVPDEPQTQIGDVYELGHHKLFCKSSTDEHLPKDISENSIDLIVTDPPYNIGYEGKTEKKLKIQNDKMKDFDFYNLLFSFYKNAFLILRPGKSIYVFHSDSEGANFRVAYREAGLYLSQVLIWVKNYLVIGRSDYHWRHEPCLYGWKPGAKHLWNSDRKQSTVLEFDKPSVSSEHPTMKPIPLISYLINNSSQKGEIVFDGFLGSGTTLIACEQLGRICVGCEIDPAYCDVIVDRYVAYKKSKRQPYTVKKNGVEIENG